jgi:hypothetical protein
MGRREDIPRERGDQQLNGCIALGLRSDTPSYHKQSKIQLNATENELHCDHFANFTLAIRGAAEGNLRFWDDIHVCEDNRIKTNPHKQ